MDVMIMVSIAIREHSELTPLNFFNSRNLETFNIIRLPMDRFRINRFAP